MKQRLARSLDRPGFPWKRLIVGFSVGQYLFETFLSFRQYKVLQQTKPPKTLETEVSQEVFDKSQVRISLLQDLCFSELISIDLGVWTCKSTIRVSILLVRSGAEHWFHLLRCPT